MANEWTKADVLRVMQEKSASSGKVSMADVLVSFNISSGVKSNQFYAFLNVLVEEGSVQKVGGWYFVSPI